MAGKCEECGCVCAKCKQNEEQQTDVHLHAEIENLRQRLMERDTHIVKMETQFLNDAEKFPNGELASMKEESKIWQEKYNRLYEAHKRIQKVNQNLEDKLLRIVDKCETEKGAFAKDIATLSHRLADANYTIHRLTQDNEKYRNDVNLAIQLLQCKPSNFVGQKYDSLPSEVQAKVRTYVAQKRRSSDVSVPDVKSITVPISTFPPTAMVYNITKSGVAEKHSDDESDDSKAPVDVVSAAIMAKVLEDRERERIFAKHCNTCTCHRTILMMDSETQTISDRRDFENFSDEKKVRDGETEENNLEKMVESTFRRVNELKISRGRLESSLNDSVTNGKSRNQNLGKQKIVPTMTDRGPMGKTNLSKSKQIRCSSKRMENDETRGKIGTMENWSKYEKETVDREKLKTEKIVKSDESKELSPIDIINDRIWKSGWNTKSRLTNNGSNNEVEKKRTGSSTEIDVINDRAWKNDRTSANTNKTRMTVIEVTNAIDSSVAKDFGQPEVAVSPSFSSDSIVISTSNQSSSSSDALHNISDGRVTNKNEKANGKERSGGPRNCFMRVTPGSKNILLDNVGHYQTVLYTSGSNRPNTALVHVAKSTRSGRSMSTSSEENSPIVASNDSTQLQRVAEWVQSSVAVENNANKMATKDTRDQKNRTIVETGNSETLLKIHDDENSNNSIVDTNLREALNIDDKIDDNPFGNTSGNTGNSLIVKSERFIENISEDLISFENTNPQINDTGNSIILQENNDNNYEVNITKEMEEIYLKLAASLDPVTLRLPDSSGADLTIENYRKDHRRLNLQKLHEKPK